MNYILIQIEVKSPLVIPIRELIEHMIHLWCIYGIYMVIHTFYHLAIWLVIEDTVKKITNAF